MKNTTLGLSACLLLALAPQSGLAKGYQPDWPHAASAVQPDPAVKYGRLANGMRYAILKNNTPLDATSMRLVIDAGSIQESDAQQGVAHLLEHMAFRGSKRVPDGEVVKTLERLGLQFGADTNATTSFTQTVYRFDLPGSGAGHIDEALLLLREIASELDLGEQALTSERGVVLSEYRLRMNTPQARASLEAISSALAGQRAAQRLPIGKPEIIEKANTTLLRNYYHSYYRPERATLLVVGHVDVAELEQKIASHFADWKAQGTPAEDPDFGQPVTHSPAVKTYFEKELPTTITLNWTAPYRSEPESRASNARLLTTLTGIAIINQRLQQTALKDGAAFTAAQASWSQNFARSAQLGSLTIVTTPETWQAAVAAAREIFDTALTHGVTQDEVERMASNIRASLQNQLQGATTRQTAALIDSMVGSLDDNAVFESPQQQLDHGESVLKTLSAEQVTAAVRVVYRGTPLAFMTSTAPIANSEANLGKLLVAHTDTAPGKPANGADAAPTSWPYTHFGEPGKIVLQTQVKDPGATFVRFANNVVLGIKPSGFKKDEIEITVKVPGGLLGLPNNLPAARLFMSSLLGSGLEAIDQPTMQTALAGKTVGMQPTLGEAHLVLRGVTTPRDLDTELQLLTAYLVAPVLRSGAVEQMRQGLLTVLPQLASQPAAILGTQLPWLLHGNDPRWAFPDAEAVRATKIDDLKAWLLPALRQGSVEVNIVGDVTVERAIAAVAPTLGAIAQRPQPIINPVLGKGLKFPAGGGATRIVKHKAGKDKAALVVAWPAPDRRSDQQKAMDATLLSAVMQNRLIDVIRGKFGAGYAPQSIYDGSWFAPAYGSFVAISDAKPEQTQAIFDAIAAMSANLREQPIGKDELDRALQPVIAATERSLQANALYGMLLVSPEVETAPMDFLRNQVTMVKAVTPERLQRIAREYLVDAKAVRQVVLPE